MREATLPAGRSPRMTLRRNHAYLLGGPMIALLAMYVRFGEPQRRSALIAACVASEPFHVVMHLLLYGTLTWLVTWRFADRAHPMSWRVRGVVLGVVLAMGVLQELAQVIGARRFGGPELFDLAVDAVAAAFVLALPG